MVLALGGIITICPLGYGIFRQVIRGKKFGNNPMSDNGLILTFFLTLALFMIIYLLFLYIKLTLVVDENGIEYRFSPFHIKFHRISWDMIEKYGLITYHPIRDYGGWGIKFNRGGKAYSVSGNKGLQLCLKTGKRILIGTQRDAELAEFLGNISIGLRQTSENQEKK